MTRSNLREVGAVAVREWILAFEGCCGSQTRAPLNLRRRPRLGGILMDLEVRATVGVPGCARGRAVRRAGHGRAEPRCRVLEN
jgi:hypothetical protein